MPSIKNLFSTPKKAAVSVACLLVLLATVVICIVYAVNANSPAENSSIGGESAQNFAFADAGVDPASAQAVQVKFERYQGEFVYEVEFIAGDTEYEYKINAADGSVVKKEQKTVKGPGNTGLPSAAVTLEAARDIALADAGVSRESAVFTEAKEDMEGAVLVYEFQFYVGNMEYEYEINAQTGAVYSKKTTTYVAQNPVGASTPPAPTAPQQSPRPTAQPTQPPAISQPPATLSPTSQPTSKPSGLYIGSEAAKGIALADAGVSAGEAQFTKVRMDYEDGIAVYELEFYTSTHEYEYKINAQTGAVYDKSVEGFSVSGGYHSGQHHGGDQCISAEQARTCALNHAGCNAGQVVFTKTELDYDDGVAVYEIEFYMDGMEYELEIDAVTGAVLKYEAEPIS